MFQFTDGVSLIIKRLSLSSKRTSYLQLQEILFKMRDKLSINRNIRFPSICLNEVLSHCFLHSMEFCDQFFSHFTQHFRSSENL